MADAVVWSMMAMVHAAAQSQTPPSGPLSLEDCVRLAQAAPSSVAVARYQAEIARFGIKQARAEFFPTASLSGAYTYNSPLHRRQFRFFSRSMNRSTKAS
jgi:outer membrane protein TolC